MFWKTFVPQSVEIDDTVHRISCRPGVIGVMVFNYDGVLIQLDLKSKIDKAQAKLLGVVVAELVVKGKLVAKSVPNSSDKSRITMTRIKSSKFELIISSEKDIILVSIHQQANDN